MRRSRRPTGPSNWQSGERLPPGGGTAAQEAGVKLPVPEQIVNTGNVIKCFDGELYMMNTAEDSVEIMRITDGDYIAPEDYVSPLGAIMEE